MTEGMIRVAVIGRPHGVRGRMRVHALTEDPGSLASLGPLTDTEGRRYRLVWEAGGVAHLIELRPEGEAPVASRTAAQALTNRVLHLPRAALPAPDEEEYYVADLIGCKAKGPQGALGEVVMVHDYGAGASLEIARAGTAPLLVPFTRAAVPGIDLARREITVIPPAEIAAETPT
ncbi:MAG: ribosome maturation factor RimM [Acetobacteraceae bacterium]